MMFCLDWTAAEVPIEERYGIDRKKQQQKKKDSTRDRHILWHGFGTAVARLWHGV
tara:strand:- start:13988 stop:14152 length:165 start_codon:yes stop_codon:yes gene_type:complete